MAALIAFAEGDSVSLFETGRVFDRIDVSLAHRETNNMLAYIDALTNVTLVIASWARMIQILS